MNQLRKAAVIAQELEARYATRIRDSLYRTPPACYASQASAALLPVVLLPGVRHRWGYLKGLADALARRGHSVHVVSSLGTNMRPIPETAERVRRFLDERGLRRVIFVGHSKGGLVGKYYLAHCNAEQRVVGVVAIATPFSGTYATRRAAQTPANLEFAVDSPVILALQRETTVNTRIVSIYPEFDTHIWHEHKSRLDGALRNIELPVGGHNSLVGKAVVQEAVCGAVDQLAANARSEEPIP